jgi:hypothetical protein
MDVFCMVTLVSASKMSTEKMFFEGLCRVLFSYCTILYLRQFAHTKNRGWAKWRTAQISTLYHTLAEALPSG